VELSHVSAIPRHVAIAVDGNRRWAERRGLPRTEGCYRVEHVLLDVAKGATELGITFLTLHLFSSENWERPICEVAVIMDRLSNIADRLSDEMPEIGLRVRWLGRSSHIPAILRTKLEALERRTAKGQSMTLTLCVDYSDRAEIAAAVTKLASGISSGEIADEIEAETVSKYLASAYLPDVDLYIRTSGEQRISNFLPWQLAYAELIFLDTCWPDFSRFDLVRSCEVFRHRRRRFGAGVPFSL